MTLNVPLQIGTTAQGWDEQHLDLQAAGQQIGAAGTGGFTSAVSSSAAQFVSAWTQHADGLATAAEAQADGLRTALSDYLETDQVAFGDLLVLRSLLVERR